MSAPRVNCHAKYSYQVKVQTLDAKRNFAVPNAGTVTGLTLRLSATEGGAAIDPAVGGLPAVEAAGEPGTFYVEVSKALHEAHILTLGAGVSYWAIWSHADFDMEQKEFAVDDGTTL